MNPLSVFPVNESDDRIRGVAGHVGRQRRAIDHRDDVRVPANPGECHGQARLAFYRMCLRGKHGQYSGNCCTTASTSQVLPIINVDKKKRAEHSFRRAFFSMGDTGFEPIDGKGLIVPIPKTHRVHSEEPQDVALGATGHLATHREQPKDTQAHAPCGTGVAQETAVLPVTTQAELSPELQKIVSQWPNLPEHIRAAILTLIGAANK